MNVLDLIIEGLSGLAMFIYIHDLGALTAELARLLGVTFAETTLPVLKTL